MSHKQNWLEKQFDFDFPASQYAQFIQFLRQAPTRLEAMLNTIPREVLIRRDGDAWSIQENAGHF